MKFRKPPIDELIIGTYFDQPLRLLRNEHIGLFWSRIRNDFPTVQQRPPLGGMAGGEDAIMSISDEFSPMPRFWFISKNEINLIQVQKSAFLMNWRRREQEYPSFAQLKPLFDKYYGIFEQFVHEDIEANVRINTCELTYINVIEPSDYWAGPRDTPSVLPSFSILKQELDKDMGPDFNCTYRYEFASDLRMHIRVTVADIGDGSGSSRLVIEFKAIGQLGSVQKIDADKWYKRAHEAIAGCFGDLTSEDVQRKNWMIVEEGK